MPQGLIIGIHPAIAKKYGEYTSETGIPYLDTRKL